MTTIDPWEGHILAGDGSICDEHVDSPDTGCVYVAVCRQSAVHTGNGLDDEDRPITYRWVDDTRPADRIYIDNSSDDWGGSARAALAIARAMADGLNTAGFNASVREALAQLDGTPRSAVALLTGVPADQIDQYGGCPDA